MQKIDVDQLMVIAAEAFARNGFTGISMREVSSACGVSLPTLYYYFGSKDKLFEAVCRDRYRKALEHMRAEIDLDAPADRLEAQLESLCLRLFDLLTGDQTLFLLLRRDLIHGSQSQREFRSRLQYDGMIEILQGLLSQRFDQTEAERLAFTASSLIFGYCEFVVITGADGDTLKRRRQDLLRSFKSLLVQA